MGGIESFGRKVPAFECNEEGVALWNFCFESVATFRKYMENYEKDGFHSKYCPDGNSGIESLIIHLWFASRSIPENKKTLDTLFELFFRSLRSQAKTMGDEGVGFFNHMQTLIHKRYAEYYAAYDSDMENIKANKPSLFLGKKMYQALTGDTEVEPSFWMQNIVYEAIQIYVLMKMKFVQTRYGFQTPPTSAPS